MPIVVMSAVIGILQYFRILQFLVVSIGSILSKVTGMGKLESFNAVSSLSVGQSENFLYYKNNQVPAFKCLVYNGCNSYVNCFDRHCSIVYDNYRSKLCLCCYCDEYVWRIFVLNIINPYEKLRKSHMNF